MRRIARFVHSFWQRVPLIGRRASTEVAIGGGEDTLNRAAGRFADPDRPFDAVHGAGFRAVYDLSELSRSRFILATGQSGNPLSRHYRDLTELWRAGDAVLLNAPRSAGTRGGIARGCCRHRAQHRGLTSLADVAGAAAFLPIDLARCRFCPVPRQRTGDQRSVNRRTRRDAEAGAAPVALHAAVADADEPGGDHLIGANSSAT